jgi:hypothetical protein
MRRVIAVLFALAVPARSTPYDLAPTLGSWLGVNLPDATGNRLPVWRQ